jgi:rsbT co-antagonist protein RsbR
MNNNDLESGSNYTSAEELCCLFDVTQEDLERLKNYGEIVIPKFDRMIELFYNWLKKLPEYNIFFSSEATLQRVKQSQVRHWEEFFSGVVDDAYLKHRRQLGHAHARIGLDLKTYLMATDKFLNILTTEVYDNSLPPETFLSINRSITKLIFFDSYLVIDSYSNLINEKITEQSKAMMEMSTPVTEIWNNILMLPVVGIIDSYRSQEIMNTMLMKISDTQAQNFILDISGVGIVDTAVANHIIKITKATQLMGCECIISGISPLIAQTMVELGVDVGTIKTTASLKDALQHIFKHVEGPTGGD